MVKRRTWIRAGWFVLAVAIIGGLVLLVGIIVERSAIARLEQQTRTAALLRQAYLKSEIDRFRLLPVALADDRDVAAALSGSRDALVALDRKLDSLARATGAAQIYILDASGTALAASNAGEPGSFVGQSYAFRNYYRQARAHGTGSQFALGTISGRPGMFLCGRSRSGGYVVVKLEFDAIERQWARLGETSFITSAQGIVLITSRPEWRFTRTGALSGRDIERFRAELQSGSGTLREIPLIATDYRDGRQIVAVRGRTGDRLLWRSVPAGEAGWQLNLLAPIRGVETAVRVARLVTLLAGLLVLGLLWIVRERALRRSERATMLKARTAELENLVAARTAELRMEMDERAASETRADGLREGLRQANRLASLGQITAGIAHETAQPVAAIRSYAANGRILLNRGDTGAVADNLVAIERLTERIGQVTAELRGFARKSTGSIVAMPLAEAVEGALLMIRSRLSRVDLRLPMIAPDLMVMADKIRLEQVLVNLLQNALDALDGRADGWIALDVETNEDGIALAIVDNGPGIDPSVSDRLFTPFVTSRPAGLGLGLVIASDIMADMGGTMHLVPGSAGATFRILLRRP